MTDISLSGVSDKRRTSFRRSALAAQTAPSKKPQIKVGLLDEAGKVSATLTFDGRDAWALDQLIKACNQGCTPIDNPAPRWSHYVWKLRRAGLVIETHDEPHGGAYSGFHARYELHTKLVVLESTFDEDRPA